MDIQTHNCREMKDENLLGFFGGEKEIGLVYDHIGGFVSLVCAGVSIRISYCPFCGIKIESYPIEEQVTA